MEAREQRGYAWAGLEWIVDVPAGVALGPRDGSGRSRVVRCDRYSRRGASLRFK